MIFFSSLSFVLIFDISQLIESHQQFDAGHFMALPNGDDEMMR
jgi:hypothetical protein